MPIHVPDGATPLEISGLIPRHLATKKELNEAEFANINLAFEKYLIRPPSHRKAPFTLDWVQRVHQEMLNKVWEWAGKFRTTDFNIGIPHQHIQTSLYQLLENLKHWEQEGSMPLLERATRLHHEMVRIHPFPNGNGRWARLLANIYLRKNHHPLVLWPEENLLKTGPIRKTYIAALKTADDGDIKPLLSLHQKYLEKEST